MDWLLFSEHRLLTVTRGRVFHDGTGALRRARETFAYYPDEVWRYLLAVQWARLGEEEAFLGRSGDTGDELGSINQFVDAGMKEAPPFATRVRCICE